MRLRNWVPSFARPVMPASYPEPYVGGEVVRVPSDAGPLWITLGDDVIRPHLERLGTWEKSEGDLLARFFRQGLRFLDIGANIGYFSCLVARRCPGAVVTAFEPHPVSFRLLQLNLWESGATATAYPLALTGGDRTVTLSSAPTNPGDTRTSVTERATMVSAGACLDEIVPDAVFDLVKLDVQGFEPDVLRGMARTIKRSAGLVVVSEFWPSALRDRGLEPVAILRSYEQLGLRIELVQVGDQLLDLDPIETVRVCDAAGSNGQVNLVLRRSSAPSTA